MTLRILQGQSGVWCQGAGGTLLLPFPYAVDGRLTEQGHAEVARAGITEQRPRSRYSLTVVTATDCNLGCPYCFQNTAPAAPGRFDPPRIPRAALDDGTIERIADFTDARMRQAGLDRLFVLLFGGEPLLNPAACRALLTRLGRLAPVTASMVTNGVLLTPTIARDLGALGLRSAQITLDGPRELHDGLRTTRAGRGTFDRILDNLAAAQRTTDLRFTLRINTTAEVLPRLPELAAHLAERLDASRCVFDVAPVLNYAGLYDAGIGHTDPEVAAVMRGYAAALDHGFEVGWPGRGACGFCTERDGTTGAVVNADGTLYSCWETIGKPGYEVGTLDEGYTDYPEHAWVSCYEFAAGESGSGAAGFADRIAVGLMELLREHRRRTASARGPAPEPAGAR
ncbi:radical SAM protein [Streptomyces sp. NPDC056503]|uniref:radical SAM protein n=1 Tax=Streptomyces sp. NPDC056503 TaxID=3345842 RepID=UPI0036B84FAF